MTVVSLVASVAALACGAHLSRDLLAYLDLVRMDADLHPERPLPMLAIARRIALLLIAVLLLSTPITVLLIFLRSTAAHAPVWYIASGISSATLLALVINTVAPTFLPHWRFETLGARAFCWAVHRILDVIGTFRFRCVDSLRTLVMPMGGPFNDGRFVYSYAESIKAGDIEAAEGAAIAEKLSSSARVRAIDLVVGQNTRCGPWTDKELDRAGYTFGSDAPVPVREVINLATRVIVDAKMLMNNKELTNRGQMKALGALATLAYLAPSITLGRDRQFTVARTLFDALNLLYRDNSGSASLRERVTMAVAILLFIQPEYFDFPDIPRLSK